MLNTFAKTSIAISTLVATCPPLSADYSLDAVGARVGLDNSGSIDLRSYEAIVLVETPWEWDISEQVELEIALDGSLGVINGEGETAGMAHLGFTAYVEFDDFPLELVISSGPTLLTEDQFDQFDLGSKFQFTSAFGVDWDIRDEWTLGYRYLHISNAGFDDPNPGLNMHAVSLFYHF